MTLSDFLGTFGQTGSGNIDPGLASYLFGSGYGGLPSYFGQGGANSLFGPDLSGLGGYSGFINLMSTGLPYMFQPPDNAGLPSTTYTPGASTGTPAPTPTTPGTPAADPYGGSKPGVGANFNWNQAYQDYVGHATGGIGAGRSTPMTMDQFKSLYAPKSTSQDNFGGQFGGPVIQRGATPGYTGPGALAYNEAGILTNSAALNLPGGNNAPGAGGLGAGLGTGPGAVNSFMNTPGYGPGGPAWADVNQNAAPAQSYSPAPGYGAPSQAGAGYSPTIPQDIMGAMNSGFYGAFGGGMSPFGTTPMMGYGGYGTGTK